MKYKLSFKKDLMELMDNVELDLASNSLKTQSLPRLILLLDLTMTVLTSALVICSICHITSCFKLFGSEEETECLIVKRYSHENGHNSNLKTSNFFYRYICLYIYISCIHIICMQLIYYTIQRKCLQGESHAREKWTVKCKIGINNSSLKE